MSRESYDMVMLAAGQTASKNHRCSPFLEWYGRQWGPALGTRHK